MTLFYSFSDQNLWFNAGLVLFIWSAIALATWGILEIKKNWHPVLRTGLYRALMVALPLSTLLVVLGFPALMSIKSPPFSQQSEANRTLITQETAFSATSKTTIPVPTTEPPIRPQAQHINSQKTPTLFSGKAVLLGVFSLGIGLLLLFQLGKFIHETAQFYRFRHGLKVTLHPDFQDMLRALSLQVGLRSDRVSLATIEAETVPMTFGWRRPMIVLPAFLLEKPLEAEMAIFHELVHIRRHDFVWNWVERLLSLAFWFHPLVYLIRNRIAQAREQVCDTTVLSIGCYPADAYAKLLFQLSAAPAHRPALQMADTFMSLKTRLEAIKCQTHSQYRIQRAHRLGNVLSMVLLVLTTLLVAGTKFYEAPSKKAVIAPVVTNPDDCAFSFKNGQINLYNNNELDVNVSYRAHRGFCTGIILHPQTGLIRFSTVPFQQARRAGNVSGNLIRFSVEGFHVTISSQEAIMENPTRQPLYVAHYPERQPEQWRNNHPEGSFERFSDPLWYFGLEAEMPQEEEYSVLTYANTSATLFFSPKMVNGKPINGSEVTLSSTNANKHYFYWFLEDVGRIIFSVPKFSGARQSGRVEGKKIILYHEGKTIEIQNQYDVFQGRSNAQLWVRIDPNPRYKHHSGITANPDRIDHEIESHHPATTNTFSGFSRTSTTEKPVQGYDIGTENTPTNTKPRINPERKLANLSMLLDRHTEQLDWEYYRTQELYGQYHENAEALAEIMQYGNAMRQKMNGLSLLKSQLIQQNNLISNGSLENAKQRLAELTQRINQLSREIEALKQQKPKYSDKNSGSSRSNPWSKPSQGSGSSNTITPPNGIDRTSPARASGTHEELLPARRNSTITSNGYTFLCEAGKDCSFTSSCTGNTNCSTNSFIRTSPQNRLGATAETKLAKPCSPKQPCVESSETATRPKNKTP